MALFLFTEAILKEKPIQVFNRGNLYRDFTYIDDVVNSIELIVNAGSESPLKCKVYNVGNSQPIKLLDFIESIEKHTGKTAIKEYLPMQAGDVAKTWANVKKLKTDFNYQIQTSVDTGIKNFIDWYLSYYHAGGLGTTHANTYL